MSNATLGLLISAVLLASPALAQPGADPAPQSPTAQADPTPASKAPTVDSLIVQGAPLPKTSCSARDSACVAMVVAELKARYPKELQKWCAFVEQRAAMNELMFDVEDPNHPHPRAEPFRAPPITKIACAPDKK